MHLSEAGGFKKRQQEIIFVIWRQQSFVCPKAYRLDKGKNYHA